MLAGVKDLRAEVDAAKQRLEHHGLRTILFIDEVHRFNSAQQDALLPWVENGTVTLIGATTENPYFEVNKALVSRSRLFRLQPLEPEDLRLLLERALADPEHGYGQRRVELSEEAGAHLLDVAGGDARSLLNALELAVETTEAEADGVIRIDLAIAEESIQQRAVLYDKQGDAHFDTISAFIKSIRGSDPDAALFWLARMVEAGENPRFILRRLLISAGEDIGLADPQAMVVVEACAAAFDRVGLPEGLYPLAHATLYLAGTEKSNSSLGFFDAVKAVREARRQQVPAHLRDANRDGQAFGDGVGYRYPHAYADHWVAQQYLPQSLQGEVFWQPGALGWEGGLRKRLQQRRAAQLAAAAETAADDRGDLLSSSPDDPLLNRWLQRQAGAEGERLDRLRRRFWEEAAIGRLDRVLVLEAHSLLWALDPLEAASEGRWCWPRHRRPCSIACRPSCSCWISCGAPVCWPRPRRGPNRSRPSWSRGPKRRGASSGSRRASRGVAARRSSGGPGWSCSRPWRPPVPGPGCCSPIPCWGRRGACAPWWDAAPPARRRLCSRRRPSWNGSGWRPTPIRPIACRRAWNPSAGACSDASGRRPSSCPSATPCWSAGSARGPATGSS